MSLEPPTGARTAGFRRLRSLLATWLRDLVISLAIAGFIILFLYQPIKVEGNSMLPGLEEGERVFVNKFVYQLEPIVRGDVVVFRYPLDPSKRFIKRVAALPGDRIRIDQGQVVVNGKPLAEPWVPLRFHDFRSCPETVVPPDSYFVLGDHRSLSHDSRDFGPVPAQYISGKAVFIYWPVEKLGALR